MEGRPASEIASALSLLARRALLLQEADRSGLGDGLPTEPVARAEAFLERVSSPTIICKRITDRQYAEMYSVMRPRFVHGHLYDIAELRWPCGDDSETDALACRRAAHEWATTRWEPIVEAIEQVEDLHRLGEELVGRAPVRYRELTFHVTESGRASIPASIASAIIPLQPGQAVVTVDPQGARIHLLEDHRPPINRTLADPAVKAEVHDELCPRLVAQSRATYLEGLLKSAHYEIHRAAFPPEWRAHLGKPSR